MKSFLYIIGIFLMISQNCFSQKASLISKAQKGNAKAQCDLAVHYEIYQQDTTLALFWFNKAADQGYAGGYYGLARLYEGKKNYSESAKWWEKGINTPNSEWIGEKLGKYYQEGKGVPKNFEKAAYYYEIGLSFKEYKEKNGKWPYSELQLWMYNLAVCYDSIGKYNDARKWYEETYKGEFDGFGSQKQERVHALLGLVRLYHLGLGVEKNSMMVEHYVNLFKKECQSDMLVAGYAIDCWVLESTTHNNSNDNEMAQFAISLATSLGSVDAYCIKASSYENGWYGYPQDLNKARELYEMIVSQVVNYKDIPLVKGRLGVMYYLDPAMDAKKTYAYLSAASADTNFKDGEVAKYLSFCYRDGFGVEANPELQKYWERKAAELGDSKAKEWIIQDMKLEVQKRLHL